MRSVTVRGVNPSIRWRRVGWALPWLLFQAFPIVDLVRTERPLAVRVVDALWRITLIHGSLPPITNTNRTKSTNSHDEYGIDRIRWPRACQAGCFIAEQR